MRSRRATASVALALAVALVGCDDDSGESTSTTAPAPPPKETFQKLPKLPPGWKAYANRSGGFAFGLPPGWKAADRETATRVRSFDRLVAVSITPDRRPEALQIPVADFAGRTLEALPGFEAPLEGRPSRRFKHHYKGTEVRAAGRATTGVRQQVRVFVLRRDEIATFTAVMAVNAKPSSHASEQLAERMLRTLRSRPPGASKKGDEASGRDGPDKRRR